MSHNDHSTVRKDDPTFPDRQVPGYRRNEQDSDPDRPDDGAIDAGGRAGHDDADDDAEGGDASQYLSSAA